MSDEQEWLRQLTKFRLKHIEPYMEEDDATEHFRPEIYHRMGELGLAGLCLPEQYGGSGLGQRDQIRALGEIAKSSVSYAVTLSVSTMVQKIIALQGTPQQKQQYLPTLTSGQEIASFCLSESEAGSNPSALQTRAIPTTVKGKKGYLLKGRKMWVSSAGEAATYLIMARTTKGAKGISAFLTRKDAPGFSCGKKEKKMGWRVSPTREILLENCFVPEASRIGAEGDGLKIALSGLNSGRIAIGAIAVGLSERALEEAVRYSLTREQFGSPLFDFQGLQWMMADMATETSASRLLVEQAAALEDEGKPCRQSAAMAKLKATDTAMRVTTDAVQILGGVGHTSEYPVERFMRDAKLLQIVEGSNQIQRIVIAKELKKEYS